MKVKTRPRFLKTAHSKTHPQIYIAVLEDLHKDRPHVYAKKEGVIFILAVLLPPLPCRVIMIRGVTFPSRA